MIGKFLFKVVRMADTIVFVISLMRESSLFADLSATLISLLAAGFGAYIGYRLSARHFRKTKMWDRKNSAHEACYNKICDLKFFHEECIRQKKIANDQDPEYFELTKYSQGGQDLSQEDEDYMNDQDFFEQKQRYENAKRDAEAYLEKLDRGYNELIDLVNRNKKFLNYSEDLHRKLSSLKEIINSAMPPDTKEGRFQKIITEVYRAWENLPNP